MLQAKCLAPRAVRETPDFCPQGTPEQLLQPELCSSRTAHRIVHDQLRPASAYFHSRRSPPKVQRPASDRWPALLDKLHLGLFCHFQRIVYLDAKITHRALKLGMAEKQ